MQTSSDIPTAPSQSSRIWSIFCWYMSCDIFRPNGHLNHLYLPNGVLKHVSRLDSSSRCIAQYPCFASSFVKCLAPASLWEISSRVGVLWCDPLMHLFSDFGFKHIRNAIAFTQSVGSFTFFITPMSSIFSSSLFNSSLMWTGYFLGGWMTGVALSTMCIFCFPGKLPIPWNLSGYSLAISLFVSTVVMLQLICTNPSCMDGLKLNIAVSFSHIKNFAFVVGEFLCLIFSIIEPYCSSLLPIEWYFSAAIVVLWVHFFINPVRYYISVCPRVHFHFYSIFSFFLHLRSLYWRISLLCCHHSLYLWCIGINHPLCIHFLLYKWHSHVS